MSDFHRWAYAHEKYFRKNGRQVIYKKHQMLVRREEESPWMFFIKSGYVKMMFTNETSEERILGFGMPGMTIAQSGSFYTLPHTELEYEAYSECTVWQVMRKQFVVDITNDPALLADWHSIVQQNNILLTERVLYLAERQPRKRVVAWLLGMSRYYSIQQSNGEVLVEIPMTQELMANFMHLSREITSRILNQLARDGHISIKSKQITIKNIEGLIKLLKQ